MRPGQVVADRFEIECETSAGGSSTVFRARDRSTGQLVALKVLFASEELDEERVAREAQVLLDLQSPWIVKYVGHGRTGGLLYLATEWLDGVDLATRIAGSGLTVAESLFVVRRVAETLGLAHARGVVHRDLKPSNVFLPGDDPTAVKLIDFGLVRAGPGRRKTAAGALVGTPGYMAPEQARAEADVDARADVFSLGCILFECLTGHPAFLGASPMAVLSTLLLEDAPRLASRRIDLPAALDTLVAKMLSRDPAARPRDGATLAAAIAALGPIDGQRPGPETSRAPSIGSSELRVATLALVSLGDEAPETVSPPAALVRAATEHGATVAPLSGESFVVTMQAGRPAGEQAADITRTALAARVALPDALIVVATGRGLVVEGNPVGEVIDRAIRMLGRARVEDVRVDETTAAMLDPRFRIVPNRDRLYVAEDLGVAPVVREMFMTRTNFAGRELELATLTSMLEGCVERRTASAVLLTGPSGIGKSRLRDELARRSSVATLVVGPRELARYQQTGAPECATLLERACEEAPLLLVIEDVHRADESSVQLVAQVFERLQRCPILIVMIGLTEADAPVARTWGARGLAQLRLGPLLHADAQSIARASLGERARFDGGALVDEAGGNPFVLEELLRVTKTGDDQLPDTLLGLVQGELDAVSPGGRRLLRAASFFGDRFRTKDVEILLGSDARASVAMLDEVASAGLVQPIDDDHYVFRGTLLRRAVHATLTDEDRAFGRRVVFGPARRR